VTRTIVEILAYAYFLGLIFWMAPKAWREIRRKRP
jgi:hypothetical protein